MSRNTGVSDPGCRERERKGEVGNFWWGGGGEGSYGVKRRSELLV